MDASRHVVRELPWLLEHVGDRAGLRACITDQRVFNALCIELANGSYDLVKYWQFIGASPQEIAHEYMNAINYKRAHMTDSEDDVTELALTCRRVGLFFAEAGNMSESIEPFKCSLDLLQNKFGPLDGKLSAVLADLARSYTALQDMANAANMAAQALYIAILEHGEGSIETANARIGLAIVYKSVGQIDDAGPLLGLALASYQELLPCDHADVAMACKLIGEVLQEKHDYLQALKFLTRAMVIRERSSGKSHPSTVATCDSLGQLYLAMEEIERAEEMFERAYKTRLEIFGSDNVETAESLVALANLAYAKKDFKTAEQRLQQAMRTFERVLGAEHPSQIPLLDKLADWYVEQQRDHDAIETMGKSVLIKACVYGGDHDILVDTLFNMGMTSFNLGKKSEAKAHIERAYNIAVHTRGADDELVIDMKDKLDHFKKAKL
jgi:tetratricopeptide (TPR) repeat protein